jgi:DNA-binding HxlR family transcriptional regulator
VVRSYEEFCPLARALDLVGGRWTMLVVRELAHGPRRFTDLREGLPGIASNLLAERLRSLEEADVIERLQVVRPVPGVLYGLTARGEELLPILRDLARWGLPLMGDGQGDDAFDGRSLVFMAEVLYSQIPTEDVAPLVVAVSTGEDTISILADNESLRIEPAEQPTPDVRIEADPSTLFAILSGRLASGEAMTSGRAVITGNTRARKRLATLAGRVGLGATRTP